MSKTDGMFDGHIPPFELNLEHAIPDDGFEHQEDLACPCHPYGHAISGVGAAIVHNRLEAKCPAVIPDWMINEG